MSEPIQFTHAWNKPYVPTNGLEKAYLLLDMKGTADVKDNRAPLNLSLVLDRSGSMLQTKRYPYLSLNSQFPLHSLEHFFC
jgi:hypothetical protein